MKANEFVKKFGITKASKLVIGYPNVVVYKFYNYDFEKEQGKHDEVCLVDIKRLVESHQIVNTTFKGLEDAKWWHECCWDCDSVAYIPTDRLKQAIADVESCMEGGK